MYCVTDWSYFHPTDATLAIRAVGAFKQYIPLISRTYNKTTFENNKTDYILSLLKAVKEIQKQVAPKLKLHFVIDREYGNALFFAALEKMGIEYTIRGK